MRRDEFEKLQEERSDAIYQAFVAQGLHKDGGRPRADLAADHEIFSDCMANGDYAGAAFVVVDRDFPGNAKPQWDLRGTDWLIAELAQTFERHGGIPRLRTLWKRLLAKRRAWFWMEVALRKAKPQAYDRPVTEEDIRRHETRIAGWKEHLLAGLQTYRDLLRKYGRPDEASLIEEEIEAVRVEKRIKRKIKPDPRKMTEDVFWQVLEEARAEAENAYELADKLTGRLEAFKLSDIVGFQKIFNQRMAQACRYDLWAVAYIVQGGSSDDDFENFRAWLISRGRATFEAALRDPERAADDPPESEFDAEPLLFAAAAAYAGKHRQGGDLFDKLPEIDPELQGSPWDERDLPKLFPKLCKRFGFQAPKAGS